MEALIYQALTAAADTINLYPGELYDEVTDMLINDLSVGHDQIVLGHGVEGLLHLISTTFLSKQSYAGTFRPSFFAYENNLARCKSVYFPAHYKEKVHLDTFIKAIKRTSVFFLASPNKETGNYLLNHNDLEHVLSNYKGLFVVDECYLGLGGMTVIDLLPRFANLLVLRSVSKSEGLASLRIGYATGCPTVVSKLKYHQNDIEYDPINTPALRIFLTMYPHFPSIWKTSRRFFSDFYEALHKRFPKYEIIKTLTTHHFLNFKRAGVEPYKVIERMNEAGYLIAPKTPSDNSGRYTYFPGMLALTPPPLEYWGDYLNALENALHRDFHKSTVLLSTMPSRQKDRGKAAHA